MFTTASTWGGGFVGSFGQSVLSSTFAGALTQVVRLVGQAYYQLSHLA